MMDKEAQRLIIDCILTVEIGDLKRPESYVVMSEHILDGLGELGYRKLPKDKPPLVSEAMEAVSRSVANTLIEAQREADIKHYESY